MVNKKPAVLLAPYSQKGPPVFCEWLLPACFVPAFFTDSEVDGQGTIPNGILFLNFLWEILFPKEV